MSADEVSAAAAGKVAIGRDLKVNRLGYGAMRITGEGIWGEPRDPAAARALLRKAVELGVDLIDTADSYGPDTSENLIAQALHPYPDELVIATKGGMTRSGPERWERDGRPERLKAACEGSLRRLKLERIDLYQLHAPDPEVPYEESVGALAELQREGKVRHVGVSNVDVEQLRAAMGIVPVASVQNRFNVSDRRAEEVLEECERRSLAFLPWGPLDSGRAVAGGGPLGRIADARGATSSQVALAWLLHRSPAILVIPGTSSVGHLESNIAAAGLELSEEEMAQLESIKPARPAIRKLRAGVARAARRARGTTGP